MKENLHEKEREWIDRDEKLWINQDDNDHLISYVDLHLNPEKYTGYGSTSGQDRFFFCFLFFVFFLFTLFSFQIFNY